MHRLSRPLILSNTRETDHESMPSSVYIICLNLILGFQLLRCAEEVSFPEKDSDVSAEEIEGAVNTRESDSDSDVGHTSSKENSAVRKQSGSYGKESKRVSFKESLPSNGGGAGTDTKEAEEAEEARDGALSVGALTVKEDRAEGEVTWKTYLDFCKGSG